MMKPGWVSSLSLGSDNDQSGNSSRKGASTFFSAIFLITVLLEQSMQKIICDKYFCSTKPSTFCMRRQTDTVLVYQEKSCQEGEICLVDDQMNGICILAGDPPAASIFPGEKCETDLDCAYGPQVCKAVWRDAEDSGTNPAKLCLGYDLGGSCRSSADCNPDLFCDAGICALVLQPGDQCSNEYACGHLGFCYYPDPRQPYGICKKYMGLKIGERAIFSLGGTYCNLNLTIGTAENGHLLCESFYVNSTGQCDQGFQVSKKGYECTQDNDCLNSLGNPAKCSCTLFVDKPLLCSNGPEDSEWQDAKSAFIKYLRGTYYCHPARGLNDCSRSDLYNDFKCKELKAQYFTRFNNYMPSCLKNIKGGNDIYSAYYKFCIFSERLWVGFSVLLGVFFVLGYL